MILCPHGYHHPEAYGYGFKHSCDGCYCEGQEDQLRYGWNHDTTPHKP